MRKVVIDPGHGAGSVNCSPDKTYWEYEFAWDLGQRIIPLLERHGVATTVTRRADNKPELLERCKIANAIPDLDLFVSLHSNAVGAGVWVDGARGFVIYTSAAGETAGRNIAARAIIARMKEAGVILRPYSLVHNPDYTVLAKVNAPSMIVEYGFHTNREDVALLKTSEYRDLLAVATVKGILDYLGLQWQEEEIDMTKAEVQAMIDAARVVYVTLEDVPAWGKETVERFVAAGYLKGDEHGKLNLTEDLLRTLVIMERMGE